MTTAKGKTPKCKYCEEWVDKSLEQHVYHSNRYYHKECFEIVNPDGQHYKELIACICDNFNMKAPSGIILAQIKHFTDKKNMKYKGIQMTIEYLLTIEGFTFDEIHTSGIQMVEWYYAKARAYYESAYTAIDSFKGKDLYQEPEIIILKRNVKNSSKKKINIEEL